MISLSWEAKGTIFGVFLVSNDLHIPKISVRGHSIRVISAYQLLVTSV